MNALVARSIEAVILTLFSTAVYFGGHTALRLVRRAKERSRPTNTDEPHPMFGDLTPAAVTPATNVLIRATPEVPSASQTSATSYRAVISRSQSGRMDLTRILYRVADSASTMEYSVS